MGRCPTTSLLVVLAALSPTPIVTGAPVSDGNPPPGDRLSGIVLPVQPLDGDIHLRALRADAWTIDDTKRLVLKGRVRIDIGPHPFQAQAAVIWLNRLPTAEGTVTQIAAWLVEPDGPHLAADQGVKADGMLITGSIRGNVRLEVSLMQRGRPDTPILGEARAQLAVYLASLEAPDSTLARRPRVIPRDSTIPPDLDPVPDPTRPDAGWLQAPDRIVVFAADLVELVPGTLENTITAIGSVVIEHQPATPSAGADGLQLSADRAVLFLDPGPVAGLGSEPIEASSIHGIYLEGNVIAISSPEGSVVRAPRMYWDFNTSRALMLDAVLRTTRRQGRLPVYARARRIHQREPDRWLAEGVTLSTSAFRTPHLSLGASTMELRRIEGEGGSETHVDSRWNTIRLGRIPIFSWPRYRGRVDDLPLQGMSSGFSSSRGVEIETRWDLRSLMGRPPRDDLDITLHLGGYTDRGPAAGLDFAYDLAGGAGSLELYGLLDSGEDRTTSGLLVEADRDLRGSVLWEHRATVGGGWRATAQASKISDPTFISAWRRSDFRQRRAYETSLHLERREAEDLLSIFASTTLDDHGSNDWMLASRHLKVESMPDLAWRHIGDAWFDDDVSWFGETRLTRQRMVFHPGTPRESGLLAGAFLLPDGTAIGADDPIASVLLAEGLSERWTTRLTSRHELSWPMSLGHVQVAPFVSGRLDHYPDDDLSWTTDGDQTLLRGAVGVRASGTWHRVDDGVQSSLLDLHRLRHVVEPSLVAWYGVSDHGEDALAPVLDPRLDALSTGTAIRLGLRNTWQTWRGGPGRWYPVDWLRFDTDLVLVSDDADRRYADPVFLDWRPSLGSFGDHLAASAEWQVSDTVALVGETIHGLDPTRSERLSLGAQLSHSPRLHTLLEYRTLQANDSRLLLLSWNYLLSPKYQLQLTPQWDFQEDDFRSLYVRAVRSFPDFELILFARHDRILDENFVGASLNLVRF